MSLLNLSKVRRILLVEDEIDLVNLLTYHFQQNGFECYSAFNGQTALEKLKMIQFDTVLCDLNMPTMDGLTFFRESLKAHHHIPFVILTAFKEHKNVLQALQIGAFDFVEKPFEFERLMEVIYRSTDYGLRKRRSIDLLETPTPENIAHSNRDRKMSDYIRVLNSNRNLSRQIKKIKE